MAIRDTILTLKNKEGTLTNNKVCNFAYDDTAYADDTATGANGVINYNYNNHNNIPVKDNSVIKVNATVTSKGFRSQVSTLPRMLLNHIFGRVSYNLNKTVDTLNATLQALYNAIGQANGLATLDNTGRLPYSQLPLSAIEYKGAWNASANSPTLSQGTGTFGDEYIVSVQGTRNLGEGNVTFRVGDRVIYNGSVWQRIPSSSVRSVNTKTPDANGNVTVNAGDIATPDVYGYDKSGIGSTFSKSQSTFDNGTITCACSSGSMTVVGTSAGALYWSKDGGVNWNLCTGVPTVTRFNQIKYVGGLWLALANASNNNAGILWSVDGKAWNSCTISFPSATINVTDVDFDGLNYIAVDTASIYILKSTDGRNWTSSALNFNHSTQKAYIKYANSVWVITFSWTSQAEYGGLLSSTDGGITWVERASVTSWGESVNITSVRLTLNEPVYISETATWVVYGYHYDLTNYQYIGKMYTSTNGTNWLIKESISNAIISKIIYANGNVLVGKNLYYSDNWHSDLYKYTADLTYNTRVDSTNVGAYTTRVIADILYSSKYQKYLYCLKDRWIAYSTDLEEWHLVMNQTYSSLLLETSISFIGCGVSNNLYYSLGTATNNVKAILDWLIYAVDNILA